MARDWLAAKPRRSRNAWFLADLIGGTGETPFGDLRVAHGCRVRSATPSAAGRNQPAAPSAGSPAAAEVTLGGAAWSERMEI